VSDPGVAKSQAPVHQGAVNRDKKHGESQKALQVLAEIWAVNQLQSITAARPFEGCDKLSNYYLVVVHFQEATEEPPNPQSPATA
jgi:hypothetical protein